VFIDKAYYRLCEVAERWQLPRHDMVYLAENGLIRISVRLFGVHLESGLIEEDDGRLFKIPSERNWFTGLQEVRERDLFQLFRDGEAEINQFWAPDAEYRHLLEPTSSILVRESDLLLRKEERERIERQHGLVRAECPKAPAFEQLNDYQDVRLGDLEFHFGPVQARIIKALHKAVIAGAPWCIGKQVLAQCGSASSRLQDVFKSQASWRQLIESDARGRYRLRVPCR
jgi:hypothetical protein